MRILLLSDIHENVRYKGFNIDPMVRDSVDLVILLGDITSYDKLTDWIDAQNISCNIIYVAGEMDYYDTSIEKFSDLMLEYKVRNPNFYFLDNEEIILGGVRFIGGTMWSDLSKYEECDFNNSIDDFKKIEYNNEKITTRQVSIFNKRFRSLLREKSDRSSYRTVILSHFAPIKDLTSAFFVGSKLNVYYNADMSEFIGIFPLWLFGHTHAVWDVNIGGTRFISNPLGFTQDPSKPEDVKFNPSLIINI